MNEVKSLINIPNQFIQNISATPQSTLDYNQTDEHYIIPEGQINMYYWDKGYEPDIYYKMDFDLAGYNWEAIGEVIKKDTNMVDYIENMRLEIIDEIFSCKFEEVCEKYDFLLKDILDEPVGEYGYQSFSLDEAFNIFNEIINFKSENNLDCKIQNFDKNIISLEDKQFIKFYEELRSEK